MNRFYLKNDPLWADDLSWNGFQWIQPDDGNNSILTFRRINKKKQEVICICNFTPVLREGYRIGVPKPGTYAPVFCSDDLKYGGTGQLPVPVQAEPGVYREYPYIASVRVPPMSVTFFTRVPGQTKAPKKEPAE